MKLKALFESKDKKPNPMAKALSDPKFKPKTEIDKKKEAKKGYQKHKGKIEEAGYQGEVEATLTEVLGGVRSTCTYIGAKRIKDMPKCSTFVRVNNQVNQVFN